MLIPLVNGGHAIVDDEDVERVTALRWRMITNRKGGQRYAAHWRYLGQLARPKYEVILLHRFLLGAPDGSKVDHANGDGLDCRRANIRLCSTSQNNCNRRTVKAVSGYKGVSFVPTGRKWRARIFINERERHLGVYDTREEAAKAYDEAARLHFGDFAATNAEIRNNA